MSASLELDRSYLKSFSFIVKILCLLFSFIGCMCILLSSVDSSNARGSFFIFVSFVAIIATTLVLFARLFQLWQKKFYELDSNKLELYLHGCLTLLFFIASAITVSLDVASYSVATFFGLLAFSLYAYETFICFNLYRKRDAATQTTRQTPTPANQTLRV